MVETVTAETVAKSIDNEDVTLVNVLSEEDYREEHIPSSDNIPFPDVEDRFPDEYDRDDEIIVYCMDEECSASPQAAETLEEMGFNNVRDYEEGLVGWKERGHETTSGA